MPAAPQTRPLLLEMRHITKTFPGVRALDDVSLNLHAGEIHALVGENGAGKSTLMKILGGAYSHFDGAIRIRGEVQHFRSVHDAVRAGVAVVFQELSLVRELTVGENVFLGREPTRLGVIQWNELYEKASAVLKELGLALNPRTQLAALGAGQHQLVEIAKALSQHAGILVLDEPTAALTDKEAASLFTILGKLRNQGMGIIYVSHRLEEVFRLSDRVTVLRDGKTIDTNLTKNLSEGQVIAKMVGREMSQLYPVAARKPAEAVMEVRHLRVQDAGGRPVVQDVSFAVCRGEVLGIAGLIGAGRTELLMGIFAAWNGNVSGEILMDGRSVKIQRPADAIAHRIGLVTEDRKRSGLVLEQTILSNITLVALREVSGRFVTNQSCEIAAANPLFDKLRITAGSLFTVAKTLSGGNQQKVVLAKWLLSGPRVLLLDEPTRGIDIGAKQEIYATIDGLAQAGLAVVMVSSDLPEILGVCDRILVLHEGQLTGEFSRGDATPEAVMACATGQLARA
jgi:D-xylose transport system ATP-binding protein